MNLCICVWSMMCVLRACVYVKLPCTSVEHLSCVCSVCDRWGVILECLCAFRGPMETSSRKDAVKHAFDGGGF